MKHSLIINPDSGLAYISRKIREEGYVNEIECLPNAITITLIRPGSSLADVKKSLQNVIKDIDLKLKNGGNINEGSADTATGERCTGERESEVS